MRVAALYDVHGNRPALEAVLADVERAGVDTILFGGDLVAGPFPRETVQLVRSLDAVCVRGNADELSRPWDEAEEGERQWLLQRLDEDDVRWLGEQPYSWSADDTLYVHCNPVDFEVLVTAWTPEEEVAPLLADVAESRVVSGHVHMQFARRVGDVEWVGAGSVGLPYADAPGAYWTLLEPGRAEHRRTAYDLEAAAAAIRGSGHPHAEELAAEHVVRVPTADDFRRAWG